MAVSPQVKIRLMRMQTLEDCNNCRRFIVWHEGLRPAETELDEAAEVASDA